MTIYATGADYSNNQTPTRILLAHGASFACRYASTLGNPKNLTPDEARLLPAAGIGIVSLFETTANRALSGRPGGHDDSVSGRAQHRPLGLSDDRPLYFTVDWDMQASQEPAVFDYFRGAHDGAPASPLGVYGGLRACESLLGAGLVDFVFQTYAWSGGLWAATTHLRQVHNGANWDGFTVDLDEAHAADYGQWGAANPPAPGPAPVPTNWTDAMIRNLPNISQGAKDPAGGPLLVHRLQAILRDVAGYGELGVDGDFGPLTNNALRNYQGTRGLTADGIVGPHTWQSILVD